MILSIYVQSSWKNNANCTAEEVMRMQTESFPKLEQKFLFRDDETITVKSLPAVCKVATNLVLDVVVYGRKF